MYTAVHDLLQGAIDYAGLFPPAKLPLQRVVTNYADYLQCDETWMLGRLIVPLEDAPAVAALVKKIDNLVGTTWRLSCLLSGTDGHHLRSDIQGILDFNNEHRASGANSFVIDAVEIRASRADEIETIANALPSRIETFVELPYPQSDSEALIARLADAHGKHVHAKIRTGGVLTELIPDAATVTSFISDCAKHQLGFKATAGLHHPIRGQYALTYDDHAEQSVMHGFLNMLLATALLYDAPDSKAAADLLIDTNPNNFVPTDRGWRWRDQEITRKQIRHMRDVGMISFGSCSFIEPIEELQALGIELTPTSADPT
jgi:hypothetical protein